ncbi:LysR family transcriptional regulator [Pseudomonas fulva]|uniref:LysR family transcriptional regulator n=1 Tax=Pseudomonas fulva TaxID=47880 RepID=UPI00201E011B|nr:LysR family transcriptional regulator [Pseudomonas fulva]UQY33011.1 LysR family transcriptional regulator [Pseudomonas fulva]
MTNNELQLDWLKCFLAVVDTGSLSRAALEVNRSQSAVSMQIKKLEAATGRQLLSRSPKHMHLTEDGLTLFSYARQMVSLHTEIQTVFHGSELHGKIQLGVTEDYAAHYLTPLLKRFSSRHSEIEIELVCDQSSKLIPLIQSEKLDLALVSRSSPAQGTFLFEEPMVWVGSPYFELWRRKTIPVAVFEEHSLARNNAISSLVQQGREFKIVYHSASLAGQYAAVEGGLAIAALTQCSVPSSLKILGEEQGLGDIKPLEVSVLRSRTSARKSSVDHLHNLIIASLKRAI